MSFLNNWDAGHYLYLAEYGYSSLGDKSNLIVFFPFYPALINLLTNFTSSYSVSSLIISFLSFILGSIFFYKLLVGMIGKNRAFKSLLALVLFPTSYFLFLPYSESLFFLLVTSALYFSSKRNFPLSGFISGLASFTRPTGFLITIAIFIDWYQSKNKKMIDLVSIFFPTAIFWLGYLLMNSLLFNNPLQFQFIQKENWHKYLAFPIEGTKNTLSVFLSIFSGLTDYNLMFGVFELSAIIFSVIGLLFLRGKIKTPWYFYYVFSLISFLSTGFIYSMPRYLLSIPFFSIMISFLPKKYFIIWIIVSSILLVYFSRRFYLHQWAF